MQKTIQFKGVTFDHYVLEENDTIITQICAVCFVQHFLAKRHILDTYNVKNFISEPKWRGECCVQGCKDESNYCLTIPAHVHIMDARYNNIFKAVRKGWGTNVKANAV